MAHSRALALAVLLLWSCSRSASPTPGTPDDLAAYLRSVAGADEATRHHELATWILDEPTWRATVSPAYASLQPDYARTFDTAIAPLLAQLAARGEITARRHYAGDLRLTDAQARLRWALPVQYPSAVAELAGKPIDTVFVFDGNRWRALAGLDELVLARVRALDASCAELLAHAGPPSHCTEVGWLVADAALRSDRERFAHGCALAANLCANRSP